MIDYFKVTPRTGTILSANILFAVFLVGMGFLFYSEPVADHIAVGYMIAGVSLFVCYKFEVEVS
jgi:hypothetical protein